MNSFRKIDLSSMPNSNSISPLRNLSVSPTFDNRLPDINPLIIANAIKKLANEWETQGIDKSLQEVYLKVIDSLTLKQSLNFINKEISNLKSNTSLVQACSNSIKAREDSIKTIYEVNQYLSGIPNWNKIESVSLECAEVLNTHRMITLLVCESIYKWKESLSLESNASVEFVFNDMNYLDKIKTDLSFLKTSEMAKIFKFSSNFDPFLVTPSKTHTKNFILNQLTPSSEIIKKINDMEKLIKTGKVVKSKHTDRNFMINIDTKTKFLNPKPDSKALVRHLAKNIIEVQTTKLIAQSISESFCEYLATVIYNKIFFGYLVNTIEEVIEDTKSKLSVSYIETNTLEKKESLKITKRPIYTMKKLQPIEGTFDGLKKKYQSVKNSELIKINTLKDPSEKTPRKENTSNEGIIYKNEYKIQKVKTNINTNIKISKSDIAYEDDIKFKTFKKIVNKTPSPVLTHNKKQLTDLELKVPIDSLYWKTIPEAVLKIYIEELIVWLDLKNLSESVLAEFLHNQSLDAPTQKVKRERLKKRLSLTIKNFVYDLIIESFINQSWVESLASSLLNNRSSIGRRLTLQAEHLFDPGKRLEEIEEYVHEVFTPGVHSPNNVLSRINSVKESLDKLSIASESFVKFSSPQAVYTSYTFEPMFEKRDKISKTLTKYFELLPSLHLNSFLSVEKTIKLSETGQDSSWFWSISNSEIIGCLVFSTDPYEMYMCCTVHHISVINPSMYSHYIRSSIELLYTYGYYKIFFEFPQNVHPDIQKVFLENQCREKQKINSVGLSYFVKKNLQKTKLNKLKFKVEVKLEITGQCLTLKNDYKEEMSEVGTRINLLFALTNFIKHHNMDTPSKRSKSRLQNELNDLLEIIMSLDTINFESFPLNFNSNTYDNSGVSTMLLNINWTSCAFFNHIYQSETYKFIRFTNITMTKLEENFCIYFAPTNNPDVLSFFIVFPNLQEEIQTEVEKFKTDLFCKVENIFKTIGDKETCDEIWLPGFSKSISWGMTWMEGFEVENSTGENMYVSRSQETVEIEMEFPAQSKGLLKSSPPTVVYSEFIFGITHKYINTLIEAPILVCLVKQSDWIAC